MSQPRVVQLGQLDGGHDYVDIARHPDAVAPAGVAVWRPAEPLFFANAERVLAIVGEAIPTDTRAVVLSLEESPDLDATALEALLEFDRGLARRGVTLRLARVRDAIRDLLAAAGAGDLVARASYSVDDAVRAATSQLQPERR
jgi:MFS superfamily sulfate permease-like transporter